MTLVSKWIVFLYNTTCKLKDCWVTQKYSQYIVVKKYIRHYFKILPETEIKNYLPIRDEVDDCLLEEEEDDEDEVLTAEQDEALVGLCSTLFGTLLLSEWLILWSDDDEFAIFSWNLLLFLRFAEEESNEFAIFSWNWCCCGTDDDEWRFWWWSLPWEAALFGLRPFLPLRLLELSLDEEEGDSGEDPARACAAEAAALGWPPETTEGPPVPDKTFRSAWWMLSLPPEVFFFSGEVSGLLASWMGL